MNREPFLQAYLGDGRRRLGAASAKQPAKLPFLEERHFFSGHEPYRYMDHFAVEYLTRDELLALVEQLNIDHIKNPTSGQLRALAHGRQQAIDGLHQRLAEQEQVIAAQAVRVETLNGIYQRRAYRAYRRVVIPYKAWRLVAPLVDEALKNPAAGVRRLRALLSCWRQGGSAAVKAELRRFQSEYGRRSG